MWAAIKKIGRIFVVDWNRLDFFFLFFLFILRPVQTDFIVNYNIYSPGAFRCFFFALSHPSLYLFWIAIESNLLVIKYESEATGIHFMKSKKKFQSNIKRTWKWNRKKTLYVSINQWPVNCILMRIKFCMKNWQNIAANYSWRYFIFGFGWHTSVKKKTTNNPMKIYINTHKKLTVVWVLYESWSLLTCLWLPFMLIYSFSLSLHRLVPDSSFFTLYFSLLYHLPPLVYLLWIESFGISTYPLFRFITISAHTYTHTTVCERVNSYSLCILYEIRWADSIHEQKNKNTNTFIFAFHRHSYCGFLQADSLKKKKEEKFSCAKDE